MLHVGATLGTYTIEGVLGQGGMGSVYRAHDSKLHRRVALKLVRADGAGAGSQSDSAARLLREARAAAAFDHPNVVTIFEVGEIDGELFIAMELVPGRTLREIVDAGGVTVAQRLRWLLDVARALAAAHRAGLVHRDVKPENVIVRQDGLVKVLDFGIAKRSAAPVDPRAPTAAPAGLTLTADGIAVGTPLYMAPEQLRGDFIDGRTDVWAWGVTAYEVLSGKHPWASRRDAIAVVAAILADEPVDLRVVAPEVPDVAAVAVRRAMRKAPAERFASMDDLIATIEAEPSAALTAPTAVSPLVAPAPPRRRRRPTWKVALVALVALAALASASAVVLLRGPSAGPGASGGTVAAASEHAVAAEASAAPGAAPKPTAITELPPPKCTPEAMAAYVAGVRALRDANWGDAVPSLERAATLDPSCPEAQLRVAVVRKYVNSRSANEVRAGYGRAYALRDRLSERDRALLEAMEPTLSRDPPEDAETARRLILLTERFPGDAELAADAALFAARSDDTKTTVAYAERAVAIDPRYADGWQNLARAHMLAGDAKAAHRAVEECARVAPGSADCLLELMLMEASEGACDQLEADDRRALAIAPNNEGFIRSRAGVLYALGRPREVVELALASNHALIAEARRPWTEHLDAARLAILDGDFPRAERSIELAEADVKTDTNADLHAAPAALLTGVRLESDHPAEAATAAQAYLAGLEVWSANRAPHRDPVPLLLHALERGGKLEHGAMVERRAKWFASLRKSSGWSTGALWALGYGPTVVTREDAVAALAELGGEPQVRHFHLMPSRKAWVGKLLLQAGKPAEAVTWLRAATGACDGLFEPVLHTHAMAWLGEALEATNDKPGACAAYRVVLDRWGHAKPKSVTAARVRARSTALGCTP